MPPLMDSLFASSDLTQLPMFTLATLADAMLTTPSWSSWSSPSSVTRSPSAVSSSTMSTASMKRLPTTKTRTANLYLYRTTTPRLVLVEAKKVTITLEEDSFASGGVCEAFKMWMVNADGTKGQTQVAKQYKFKDGKQGFREDHVSWFMANAPVAAFNTQLKKVAPKSPMVSFMPCVSLIELDGQWYSVEDFLEGRWTKYNNIFGTVESIPAAGEGSTYQNLAAAFSHFSFQHSGHEHLVLDIQGVEGRFTDPAIVSRTASKYGYTDTGLQGMQGFFSNHTCNHLCHKLGLKSISPFSLPPVTAAMSTTASPAPSKPGTSTATATTATAATVVAAAPTKKPKPAAAQGATKPTRKQEGLQNTCRQASLAALAAQYPASGSSLSWDSSASPWAAPTLASNVIF